MKFVASFVVLAAGTFLLISPIHAQGERSSVKLLPAFPGAEGFGAYTTGGRGGDVYLVTTLADYDEGEAPIEGSFRAAVEASGPRTVIFRVAGYIDLVRPMQIVEPYLTIAGQTAPGDGVTIRRHGIDVAAPQVIIRYLRIRPGDVAGIEQDGLNIRSADVMVDHCSVSWGTDETLSIIGEATNVTVQWCLISESLHHSVHEKGGHGYGTLLTATGDVSIHHSAYALHHSRNPRPKSLRVDFRNNLVYGYGGEAGYNYDDFTRMNYVGNYLHPLAHSRKPTCAFSLGGLNSTFHFSDNVVAGDWQGEGGWDVVCFDGVDPAEAESAVRTARPVPVAFVSTDSPHTARERILQDAGASLPARDGVDARLVAYMRDGRGEIIDSQEDVGGWPVLRSAPAPLDSDGDGMPDDWEVAHQFDPHDPSDQAADADGDGYTNLEEYLNQTDPRRPEPWIPPPAFAPPSGSVFTDTTLTVTIEALDERARIYYTLDGSEPDANALRYEGPFSVRSSSHVRAIALVNELPTMPAIAEYARLEWLMPDEHTVGETEPGLRYAYYQVEDWDDREDLAALEPIAYATGLELDLQASGPARGQGVVADGLLHVPADGIYGFLLVDSYRSELRLGDQLVTRGRPADSPPAHVALRAGFHRFHVRSLREEYDDRPRLLWAPPGESIQRVPATRLHHVAAPTAP